MNNRGFTLIEMLGCVLLLGLVLCIGLFVNKKNLTTSLASLTNKDELIYEAAKNYVIDKDISFNDNNYACVDVADLVMNGYLNKSFVKNNYGKTVKVVRNNKTKFITNAYYDEYCD